MIQPDPKKSKAVVVKKTVTVTPKKVTSKKPVRDQSNDNPADEYKGLKDAWGNQMGGEGRTPPFKKGGVIKKKMKAGGSFAKLAPPYDKATFADKIAGATKNKAKSGKTIKKAQTGDKLYPTSGVGGKDMPAKNGKSMKKCKYGCK
jgi:hypothetical protein